MVLKKAGRWVVTMVLVGIGCATAMPESSGGSSGGYGHRVAEYTVLTADGGRVARSPDNTSIAFDRLGKDGWFDLWVMDYDGKHQVCLTNRTQGLPQKHVGQPAWHPSGKFLVIQAQKEHVPRYLKNKCTPGAGALNDLWIVTAHGRRCWKLYTVRDDISKDSAGVLHPHFSHDGTRLFWSERIRENGRAFGEWILRIAEFHWDDVRGPWLGNIRDYNPGGRSSFFESHGFSPNDQYVLFTGNQHGPLEIYEMEVATGKVTRLTHSPRSWDEHAHYSPDGKRIVWMSSKGLRFETDPFFLQAEFWIMDRDGSNKRQVTWFNTPGHPHYLNRDFAVAADCEWSLDGTQVIGLVITNMPHTQKRGQGIVLAIDVPR